MDAIERQIRYYTTRDGKTPYWEWHSSLDSTVQQMMDVRLGRVRLGNFGHCEALGEGILELKIDYGPGYRIYFGLMGHYVILLFTGGDKSTQKKDIRSAKEFWQDYKTRKS